MARIELPVSLGAFGFPSQPATAVVIEQSPGQRLARSLAGLGLFWGCALGGLFIPVAHFVLVPTFVAAGIVVAIKRAREDRRLVLVQGPCPRCAVEQEFKPGGRFANGRSFDCPRCHGNLSLAAGPASEPP